jgi:hypothetical protein
MLCIVSASLAVLLSAAVVAAYGLLCITYSVPQAAASCIAAHSVQYAQRCVRAGQLCGLQLTLCIHFDVCQRLQAAVAAAVAAVFATSA